MENVIMRQVRIFPTVTKCQLYRLVKAYSGQVNQKEFDFYLDALQKSGKIETVITETSFEYKAANV